ncbi:MAG: hemolysin family protein [Lachnospiraceae bacterium]|nr:hemolysin family protein [Lachnospiraceae bacterium]
MRTKFLKRILRGDASGGADDEIMSAVDEAHENGELEKDEAEMIENILSFGDTDAQDIMTRRSSITALEGTATLEEAVKLVLGSSFSRFPVFEGNIDTVLGIVMMRDLMQLYVHTPENRTVPIEEIPNLIRSVPVVPETRPINRILQFMRSQKLQLALVVDEYGQTAGIVTMEDILEEIVGNILDEYDPEDHSVQMEYDDSIIMEGLLPLERAGEVLKHDFGEEYETLNGYLTALLGHIPTEKDKEVTDGCFRFHILKTAGHTIRKVRAERIPEKDRV